MTYNRLGTLAAGLMGLGWLAAVVVQLVFWLPQLRGLPPELWDDSRLFLTFVRDNMITWRAFHIGTTAGLMALVMLVGLLVELDPSDKRRWGLTAVGLIGALFGLLASLIDHLGTPVLARLAAGNDLIAGQIWLFVETWRDAGLKTVSYWFLGFWVWWLGGRWLAQNVRGLGRFSQITGGALLWLALVESITPKPFIYTLGETGTGGFVVLLFPFWGLWVARWFWGRELIGE